MGTRSGRTFLRCSNFPRCRYRQADRGAGA
ncbi:MAG: hypothetical protein IT357_04035 [Gemmatimonadaceae bacterium]|nr:hypothetical protein [Gemmatimonadaceae bacterium]